MLSQHWSFIWAASIFLVTRSDSICHYVGPLVGRLVGWLVGWSVTHLFFRLCIWSLAFALRSGALQREREEEEEEEEETKEHQRVKRISTCGNGVGKRPIHDG